MIIKEICAFLVQQHHEIEDCHIEEILLERERLGSTGIGEGVAIPHGKLKGIKSLIACLARSKQGVPFDAQDGNVVSLFFVLLAPEGSAGNHLKALARVARLMHNDTFRQQLLAARDAVEIFDIVAREDNQL